MYTKVSGINKMKNELNNILKDTNPEIIEIALVQLFIDINKISINKNELIKSFLDQKSKHITITKTLLSKKISTLKLTDLVNLFELLIPQKDKQLNGAFFTPQYITDFIVHETINNYTQQICDPSCGCGAFLIAAANIFKNKYYKSIIQSIENNLYGVDIADYSIRRAKILLSLLALQNGEDKNKIEFNIVVSDSLVADWKGIFPRIMNSGGFDVVIGNPPYVKFQDLSSELRNKLYHNWRTLRTGNYNLYFAFFELGMNILNKEGTLGYITPNNYFTSLAAKQVREYLSLNKLINKIIDFNHLKLFDAQTYTAITFLDYKNKNYFEYERVDNYETLNSLYGLNYSKVYFKNLDNKKWRILREIDQDNIKKIELSGEKLGNIVDIRVGIATCKDSFYFLDGSTLKNGFYHKEYKGKIYLIEKEITRSISKISDFKDQNDLENNNRRIIFPYKNRNSKMGIIKEEELKLLFPKCYEYFINIKEELLKRDKGKVEYPEWYAYARTQGLNFYGEKLLTPTFSAKPRFLLDKNEYSLFCNGYAIYLSDKYDLFAQNNYLPNLDILGKILNSCIMDYYIKQTSVSIEGGYPCYQKNFIELFGIPNFTKEELNILRKENKRENIDKFLIEKYGIIINRSNEYPQLRETVKLNNDTFSKPFSIAY